MPLKMNPLKYASSQERQKWEDFFQNIGASLRAATVVRVLDDCRANPALSLACMSSAAQLLNDELTILTCHRNRRVLPA